MVKAAVAEPGRSYGGRSAVERDAERRSRLLAGARDVIGGEGYAATTVEKICARAGVSTRHFYLLYSTKEDAFVDLYRELTAASYRRAVDAYAATSGQPMAERVPAAFIAYLEPMFSDPPAARIAFVEVMGVSPVVEARRLEYRESLVAVIESEALPAVAAGEISDRDFRFATMCLAGALNAAAYDWVLRDDREPGEQLEQKVARLSLALLAG